MAKITPRMEKRKKWLEEKKNLSRVTRASVNKQNNPAAEESTSSHSATSTQKSKHSPPHTNKKSGKPTASQNNAKTEDSKISSSSNNSSVSNQSSRYSYNSEMTNDDVNKGSKEKFSAKKSKQAYVDAVEKLENSSSIHVPKKLVLFVGNLPQDITKEQLMTHFKRAGCGVKSVKLPKYRGTETGKGHAYVEFSSTIGHRIGLRLNNTTLAGRKIVVEFTADGKMTEKQLLEKVKQKDEANLNMPFDS